MAKVRKKKRQSRGVHEITESPRPSVGERLRQAREAQGLSVETVAQRLHLKQALVVALEEEDFERLPARVFVRGYYRNYARLLELPEAPLLREFDARCPEGEECSGAPPVVAQGVRKEIRSSHGLVRLVSWLVAISVVAALALWWRDRSGGETPPPPAPVVSQPGPASADISMEESAAKAEEAAAEAVQPSPSREEPALPPPAKEAAPAPSPPAPAAPAPAPPKVVLKFLEDSWVDVRSADRSFKLVGLRKAGDQVILEGKPPYAMILGNARGVRLLVNGEPFDLTSKTRRNVARLTLNP